MSSQGIKYVWMNGKLVEWEEAKIHVTAEVARTGRGVFEGMRGYLGRGNNVYIFRLDEHVKRLFESAKINRMICPASREEIAKAVAELVSANGFREDIYIRPNIYLGGSWQDWMTGEPIPVEVAIYARSRISRLRKPDDETKCCFSSWRRIPDAAMPARAKANANYLNISYARMEAQELGFEYAIMPTFNGKVSEATGANIFLIRDNALVTPSVTSDILEGITRKSLIQFVREDLGFDVVEREVDRSELYVADEVFLCGTGAEVRPVVSIDNIPISDGKPGRITNEIRTKYLDIVTANKPKYKDWLTPVYKT